MSAALEFGRITLPPNNPGKCDRCSRATNLDGKRIDIHWSIRAQAWLCAWCHFEAPDASSPNLVPDGVLSSSAILTRACR